MTLTDKLLAYWPALAGCAVFLALGLWWQLSAAGAMERSPKPLSWVRRYRTGGFPFRRDLPERPRCPWWALLGASLLAAAFAAARVACAGYLHFGKPAALFQNASVIRLLLLYTLGGGAVCALLAQLFDSPWVALPGALLFAASPTRGHQALCLLALSLLLLLCYLRGEKPGFPTELRYLGAVLSFGAALSFQPVLVLLLPGYLWAHWYKLLHQRRTRRLGGGALTLSLAAALLGWAAALLLAAVWYSLRLLGYRPDTLSLLFQPELLKRSLEALLSQLLQRLPRCPSPGMSLDAMADAPLLGFGLWGCRSAWALARKRRDVRGLFILLLLAGLTLIWLLTGKYLLSLGLCLSAACILRDADLAGRRPAALLLSAAGLVWDLGIQLAACFCSLAPGLLERIVI